MTASDEITGVVCNIQRYSVHDGPGIRTTVFLKGCPLRCSWCSNPETQKMQPEYMIEAQTGKKILVGEKLSVSDVMDQIKRDKVFYEGSGGGITLSGGEVLAQPEFASAIIDSAKAKGFHTAVATTGYAKFAEAWMVLKNADLILYDLKGMSNKLHRINTGVSTELIHNNLEELINRNKQIIVRIPLIPNQNAEINELQSIVDYAISVGIKTIELLPYHRLGESKYARLSRKYAWKGIRTLRAEEINSLYSQIKIPDNVALILH